MMNFGNHLAYRSGPVVVMIATMIATMITPAGAAEFYVSPEGDPGNAGTKDAPWDIVSALDGSRRVKAGDTVFLRAGTYRRRPEADFKVRLVGTKAEPIQIRPAPGARATVDGGLVIENPAAHVWIRDLEILVSEKGTSKSSRALS